MLTVSREETLERWDELPSKIREALFSEDNYSLLEQFGAKYSLSEQELRDVSIVISNILHGFIRTEKLQDELSSIPGFKGGVVANITSDIKTQIFDPLEPELKTIYKPATTAVTEQSIDNAPVAPKPPTSPQVVPETPTSNESPFMLHQHEEEEELTPRVEEVRTVGSPIRPTFYKAPNSTPAKEADSLSSKPVKARLELGIQEDNRTRKAPRTKPKPEGLRQVNYSELRTKLDDPFSARIRVESDKSANSSNEDGEEADLKDLPL